MPSVSVVMNCYNGERYLREAIDSVYAQSFGDWEIVFWDNASTDQSGSIARGYTDGRLRYFRGDVNVPLGAARMLAVEQVRGEWIGFLDADDIWLPHKLSQQTAAVAGTNHVLAYSGVREVTPDGELLRDVLPCYPTGAMFDAQLRHYDLNMLTSMLRRTTLLEHNLNFDPNVTASEEYNLFMRVAAKGTVCAVPDVVGLVRVGQGTLTDRAIAKWADERFYTLDQLERENPGITAKYKDAFAHARARGNYYRARYLMSAGQAAAARRELAFAARVSHVYRALWAMAWIPPAWHAIHSNALKRKWIPRVHRALTGRDAGT